jgi:hypothetical protein
LLAQLVDARAQALVAAAHVAAERGDRAAGSGVVAGVG